MGEGVFGLVCKRVRLSSPPISSFSLSFRFIYNSMCCKKVSCYMRAAAPEGVRGNRNRKRKNKIKNKKMKLREVEIKSVFFFSSSPLFSSFSFHSGNVLGARAVLLERGWRRGGRAGPLGRVRGVSASSSSSVAVGVFAAGGGGSRGSVPAPAAPSSVARRRRALQPRVPQGLGGRSAPVRVVLEHRHQEVGEGRGLLKVSFFLSFFESLSIEVSFFLFSENEKKAKTLSAARSIFFWLIPPPILKREEKRESTV